MTTKTIGLKLLSLSLALLLLAACSQVTQPNTDLSESAAENAIYQAVDEAFAASAEEDGIDLASQSAWSQLSNQALSSQSVEPIIVVRRTNMRRSRERVSLTIDFETEPPSAEAVLKLSIQGVAQLWQVYPDNSLPREKVGAKHINMSGNVTFYAEYVNGRWQVVNVDLPTLSQGDNAASINSITVDPDMLIAGSEDNKAFVGLSEPDTTDEFIVTARGRHLRPRGILNDNGTDPDATADDDSYAGYVRITKDARLGHHIGFLHAFNYSKTTDLSVIEDTDEYLHPYTDTLQAVSVEITAASTEE